MDTNVHIAYLRQIEETLKIRAKRFKLARSVNRHRTAAELIRITNQHRACVLWEDVHGVVL